MKLNLDGPAFGKPGLAVIGGIFRHHTGPVKGTFSIPIGVETQIFAMLIFMCFAYLLLYLILNLFSPIIYNNILYLKKIIKIKCINKIQ